MNESAVENEKDAPLQMVGIKDRHVNNRCGVPSSYT